MRRGRATGVAEYLALICSPRRRLEGLMLILAATELETPDGHKLLVADISHVFLRAGGTGGSTWTSRRTTSAHGNWYVWATASVAIRNAGCAQNWQVHVTKTMNEDLKPQTRSRMVNIADNFTGRDNHEIIDGEPVINWDGMVGDNIDFLTMCNRMNWILRTEKTFFSARECKYFGHIANNRDIQLAEHNLEPIQDMVPPRDRKELRSTTDFFGVHRAAIKGFATVAAPLTKLQ